MSASHPCLQQKQGLGQDPSSGVCGAEGPGTQPLSGMSFPSPGTETRFPQPPDAKGTYLGFFKKAVLGFFFFPSFGGQEREMSNYQPPQAGAESLRHFPSGFFLPRAACADGAAAPRQRQLRLLSTLGRISSMHTVTTADRPRDASQGQ